MGEFGVHGPQHPLLDLVLQETKSQYIPIRAKGGSLNSTSGHCLSMSNRIQHCQKGKTGVFLIIHSPPSPAIPASSKNCELLGSACLMFISLLRPPGAIRWLFPCL